MERETDDSGITLAELLAAYSLATDLGLGQPMEHLLRSWRIAARLGTHVGLPADEQAALFYVAMLSWVGCVADAPEVAASFGDDIAFRSDSYDVDLGGMAAYRFFLGHAGAGESAAARAMVAATLLATGGRRASCGSAADDSSTRHSPTRSVTSRRTCSLPSATVTTAAACSPTSPRCGDACPGPSST